MDVQKVCQPRTHFDLETFVGEGRQSTSQTPVGKILTGTVQRAHKPPLPTITERRWHGSFCITCRLRTFNELNLEPSTWHAEALPLRHNLFPHQILKAHLKSLVQTQILCRLLHPPPYRLYHIWTQWHVAFTFGLVRPGLNFQGTSALIVPIIISRNLLQWRRDRIPGLFSL